MSTFLRFDADAFSASAVLCWYVVLSDIDTQMRQETYLGRVCFGFPLVLSAVSGFDIHVLYRQRTCRSAIISSSSVSGSVSEKGEVSRWG